MNIIEKNKTSMNLKKLETISVKTTSKVPYIVKLKKYEGNPILKPNHNKWEDRNVYNAAATVYNGKVYLLYRAEGYDELREGLKWECPITRLGLAISENGFDINYRSPQAVFDRDKKDPWREYGCEDPRISKIGDTYYIVFVSMSRFGYTGDRLGLATTKDFKTFHNHGLIMKEFEQRTSGLLPGKINDYYALFHRPMPNMWISYSKDLKTWERMKCILQTKDSSWYENKLGIGAPPIETEHGWLLFWHGKNNKAEYRLGIMLLDKNDPSKIIKFQEEPILEPQEEYELKGYVANTVYTNGAVLLKDKFFVYYGCSDKYLSVATINYDEIDYWCKQKV